MTWLCWTMKSILFFSDEAYLNHEVSAVFINNHERERIQMANCTIYIDEAGDLGFNRGKKWLNALPGK